MLNVYWRRVADAVRWCLVRSIVLVSLLLLAGCQHDPYGHLYNKAAQAKPHEPLLIEPGKSVGKIKSGMTMEEVIAAVGEPDRRRGSKTLEYLRYGYAVSGSSDGQVSVVFCGGCSRGSPLIKMFAGRTKEGIGMESTLEQVVNAFGQPASSDAEDEGEEILRYRDLGLTFFLADAKVHHITVDFRKRQ